MRPTLLHKHIKIISYIDFISHTLSFLSFVLLFIKYKGPLIKNTILFDNTFLILFLLTICIWIFYGLVIKEKDVRYQTLLLSVWLSLFIFWEYFFMKYYIILFALGGITLLFSIYLFQKIIRKRSL